MLALSSCSLLRTSSAAMVTSSHARPSNVIGGGGHRPKGSSVNTETNSRCRTSGIPQGSVLGPILFVVFINDLSDTIDSFSSLFADDSKVLKHIKSIEDSFALQRDLDTFQLRSGTWLLRFHPSKCKILTQRSKLILSTHMFIYLTMSS